MNIKQYFAALLMIIPIVVGFYFLVWVLLLIPTEHQPLIYAPAVVITVLTLMLVGGAMLMGSEANKKDAN